MSEPTNPGSMWQRYPAAERIASGLTWLAKAGLAERALNLAGGDPAREQAILGLMVLNALHADKPTAAQRRLLTVVEVRSTTVWHHDWLKPGAHLRRMVRSQVRPSDVPIYNFAGEIVMSRTRLRSSGDAPADLRAALDALVVHVGAIRGHSLEDRLLLSITRSD